MTAPGLIQTLPRPYLSKTFSLREAGQLDEKIAEVCAEMFYTGYTQLIGGPTVYTGDPKSREPMVNLVFRNPDVQAHHSR